MYLVEDLKKYYNKSFIIYFWLCVFRYFKHELRHERDQFRRNLLLDQLRQAEEKVLVLMREERLRIEEENRNMLAHLRRLQAEKAANESAKKEQ